MGHSEVNVFNAKDWAHFWNTHAETAMLAAAKIAVIVVAYVILRFVLGRAIRTVLGSGLARLSGDILQARKARVRALQSLLSSAIGFVLGFVAIIMILQAAGLDIVPLITTASVAGLAIGFGAQKLVRDVISGFFILVEDQYGVGDTVTIGAVTGVVEGIEMRITKIRDETGKLYILSNGDISLVCNHSRSKPA
jgi:moderate conductance mechanosensitive channel